MTKQGIPDIAFLARIAENPYSHEKDKYGDGRKCGAYCPACMFDEAAQCLNKQWARVMYPILRDLCLTLETDAQWDKTVNNSYYKAKSMLQALKKMAEGE